VDWHGRIVRDRYVDSIKLMAIAGQLRETDGVADAKVGIGTPANRELLEGLGLTLEARPADVMLAVQASGQTAADALQAGERALTTVDQGAGGGSADAAPAPRTSAAARLAAGGESNVAIISVPGQYAALEAHRALTEDMHVFLFSDHVTVADEVALKRRGRDAGLLVMGPGCGTAMLQGVGLGFCNVVPSGPVGIVAAAGTGAQEAAVLLAGAGVGTSQIIGVGGRDLHDVVGAIMFRQGMELLASDPQTETLLLVSKPPDREAVQALADLDVNGKRVVAAFVGWRADGDDPFEIHDTIQGGALAAAGAPEPDLSSLERSIQSRVGQRGGNPERGPDGKSGWLLGLFSGGSLAHEAVTLLEPVLGPLGGNAGGDDAASHQVFDLGEEEYTQGVPHPMVDLETRIGFLRHQAADPSIGCVLLDVVLGHGSHPDPAGGLAPALGALVGDGTTVIAHVCGTSLDPQDADSQERTLRDAGVIVAPTNAAAARLAALAVGAGVRA
jgi:FdrA protein